MSLPLKKTKNYPAIVKVRADSDKITASMSDGRERSIPIAWFPRLMDGTEQQLSNMRISPGGYGIHWPDIDEDISVKAFVDGI